MDKFATFDMSRPADKIMADLMQRDFSREPLKRSAAVRLKCLDCCNGSKHQVSRCQIRSCPLWPYRKGAPANVRTGLASEDVEQVTDNVE